MFDGVLNTPLSMIGKSCGFDPIHGFGHEFDKGTAQHRNAFLK